MELSIIEQNGVKIYKIKDDKGFVREVTPEFVKFAIENGEVENCYVDSVGNIFTDKNRTFTSSAATTYLLLGTLLSETKKLVGYLLQHKTTKKVVKANKDTFLTLAEKRDVEGAFLNENNDLCLNCGTYEYMLVNVNGKLVPRKINDRLTTPAYTMSFSCDFAAVHDNFQQLEAKFVRGKAPGDVLGGGHKYPEIAEIRKDGIVVQFDDIKVPVTLLNASDIIEDIANDAELLFYLDKEAVSITVKNIDYRLNAVSLVIAAWLAYKKLANNFAKITDIMISGKDGTYWSATMNTDKSSDIKDAVKRKTKADINAIQEMYQIDKGNTSIDISDEISKQLIQGLKLGTCSIIINCSDCSYTSTAFRLDLIEKQVYMKFQSSAVVGVEELTYKGKNVDTLTPVMACIIAATSVAAIRTITTVSIMNHKDGNSFELIFKPKSSKQVQSNLIDMLNK